MNSVWHSGIPVALDESEVSQLLHDAGVLADLAGAAIRPYFRTRGEVVNKAAHAAVAESDPCSVFDPVTHADRAAEQVILEKLAELRPEDAVYGEEFGYRAGQSGLCWIIDPIDGTRGFVCGLPTWGTLIGVHNGASTIVGLMDQPILGERFYGSPQGARRVLGNHTDRLVVSDRSELADAFLCSTSPDIFTGNKATAFNRLTEQVAITRYGTDCYGYAMLAAGQVDAVVEAGLLAYDIQALIPIIQAAGGVVTDWSGQPVSDGGDVVAAATPALHLQIINCLNQ